MGISKSIVIGFFVLATAKCQENDNFQKQGYHTSKIPLGLIGAMFEEGIDRVTQQLDDLRTREDSLAADIDRVLRVLVIGLSILIIGSVVYLVYSYRKLIGSKIRIKLLLYRGEDTKSSLSSSKVGNSGLANPEKICRVCDQGRPHFNLVQCSELPKYIGSVNFHRSLCNQCLGTTNIDALTCNHRGQRN